MPSSSGSRSRNGENRLPDESNSVKRNVSSSLAVDSIQITGNFKISLSVDVSYSEGLGFKSKSFHQKYRYCFLN
jgi:hypothetical protein